MAVAAPKGWMAGTLEPPENNSDFGFGTTFRAGGSCGGIHVIPRYTRDLADPRGGVRHAVVGRGYYDPKR